MLGTRMREVRKDAGLTARRLALITGQHFTRVSKIENGTQVPTDQDIRAWCEACDAEEQVASLIATAHAVESAYQEFKRQARAGMKHLTGPHTMERYAATTSFRIYEHQGIPAVFQTEAYCRSMAAFWIDFLGIPNDLDAAVADRMAKQEIVSWRGKTFRVVLEESALRIWFGTADVQAGQLGRLLEVMTHPMVTLGIIPLMSERAPVASAGFWIFDDELVSLDTPTASIEVTRPEEVSLYEKLFDQYESNARFGSEARALIVRTLDDLH